jgi:hypothetical protein
MANQHTPPCPKCGFKKSVIPIAYGYPGEGMMQKKKDGKIWLGGCIMDAANPNWYCKDCEIEFRIDPDGEIFFRKYDHFTKELEPMIRKKKLDRAIEYAKKAHKGQIRKNSTNQYVVHPLAVMKLLSTVTEDEDLLCAAVLHDVVEDTKISLEDIREEFGQRVAEIVDEVTKKADAPFLLKSREGVMLKCADIIHNMSDSEDAEYIKKKAMQVTKIDQEKRKEEN